MKAIQTRYGGCHFRSRLEARWAVFFDALGLKWEYEPEGFDLGDGVYYLPDFRITSPQGLTSWYEVKRKGHPPCEKMKRFGHHHAEMTRLFGDCGRAYTFLTLAGDPTDVFFNDQHLHVCCRCGSFTEELPGDECGPDEMSLACWPCDMDTPSGGEHPIESGMFGLVRPEKGLVISRRVDVFNLYEKIVKACEKARSARFEHGQSGARP